MIYKFTLFLFLFGFFPLFGFSQDGTLDSSFGNNGTLTIDLNEGSDFGRSLTQQVDGKLLVVGKSTEFFEGPFYLLLRLLPNGDFDTTFGIDGKILEDYGENSYGYSGVSLQNDGKILASGVIGPFANRDFIVVRYLQSGDLDTTFASNGILAISYQDWVVSKMLVLDDNSIVLVGLTDNDTTITIARYLPNGILDLSFGDGGYAISDNLNESFDFLELKITGNNEFVLFGTRDLVVSTQTVVMKFLASGYTDTSFGDNGSAIKNFEMITDNDYIRAGCDITADGKIVIGGSHGDCLDIEDPYYQSFLLKYLENGNPDVTFGNNGTVLLSTGGFLISKIFHQENGRLLTQGQIPDCFEGSTYKLQRYFSDGYLDPSFNDSNNLEFSNSNTLIQTDGKVVGVGSTWWYNGLEDVVLVRYNNNVLEVDDFSSYGFKVFPNPSEGVFNLTHTLNEVEAIPYQVSDISGKIIQHGILEGQQSLVDLSAAQSGMYFLKASNYVTRLIKN